MSVLPAVIPGASPAIAVVHPSISVGNRRCPSRRRHLLVVTGTTEPTGWAVPTGRETMPAGWIRVMTGGSDAVPGDLHRQPRQRTAGHIHRPGSSAPARQ